MTFKYTHINNGSNNLFIYFNNMTQTGLDDNFTYYKIITTTFSDHDILFIKDIKIGYYYLTIMDDVHELITKLVLDNKYKEIVSFADSSGAIPLLNILPTFNIFKKAVIINGQVSLKKEIVNKYRKLILKTKTNRYLFDEQRVKQTYNKKYLDPISRITDNTNYEITFYYNMVTSDKVYCDMVRSLNYSNIKLNYENLDLTHIMYIIYKVSSSDFFNDLKTYLESS